MHLIFAIAKPNIFVIGGGCDDNEILLQTKRGVLKGTVKYG